MVQQKIGAHQQFTMTACQLGLCPSWATPTLHKLGEWVVLVAAHPPDVVLAVAGVDAAGAVHQLADSA
jgi:hypothetical protein